MSIEAFKTNTICPVCGHPVSAEMPPIEYAPQYTGHQGSDEVVHIFRVCSPECAHVVSRDPQRFHAAADANEVAKAIT